jgi:coenzyme F420-0:L-glutamate ligase/coenzyme F420-1:gamma-L-glutamate ligase
VALSVVPVVGIGEVRPGDDLADVLAPGLCTDGPDGRPNVDDGTAALLPVDPDRSARRIREALGHRLGVDLAVVVSDTFGRTWRNGVTDVAIGIAGIAGVIDLRGTPDAGGRVLQATEVCIADEVAGAADLVMGKDRSVPAAVVRGLDPAWFRRGSVSGEVVRDPAGDLFR